MNRELWFLHKCRKEPEKKTVIQTPSISYREKGKYNCDTSATPFLFAFTLFLCPQFPCVCVCVYAVCYEWPHQTLQYTAERSGQHQVRATPQNTTVSPRFIYIQQYTGPRPTPKHTHTHKLHTARYTQSESEHKCVCVWVFVCKLGWKKARFPKNMSSSFNMASRVWREVEWHNCFIVQNHLCTPRFDVVVFFAVNCTTQIKASIPSLLRRAEAENVIAVRNRPCWLQLGKDPAWG